LAMLLNRLKEDAGYFLEFCEQPRPSGLGITDGERG
jgi:hypothetical protein